MVLKVFTVLFFLFYFVFIGDTSKFNYVFKWDRDSCPLLWDRPAHTSLVPSSRFQFQGTTYTGGRHHVIPFHVLRDFYKSALKQSREESRIGRYLAAYISTITDQYIAHGVSIQRQNPIAIEDAIIEIDLSEEMFAALTWLPGNIFIGPLQNLRHHDKDPQHQIGGDPGNAFEEYANTIIRDDEHFTALKNLNRDMYEYTQNTIRVDLFDRIMHNLDIVNRRTTPFPFNPEDWELLNGKFLIRESSNHGHRNKRKQSQIPKPILLSESEPSSDDDPFDYYVGFCSAIKRRLMDSTISVKRPPILHNVYLNVSAKMQIDCLRNTYIIVKKATMKPLIRSNRDGTEKLKKLCDNKNSCVFDLNETDGLDIAVDWYCSDLLTSIQERKELQNNRRYGSNEFELNCPRNYYIWVHKAMRKSTVPALAQDITAIFREKCDGENPCKKQLENWGLNPIVVDFSCIPIPSLFTGTHN